MNAEKARQLVRNIKWWLTQGMQETDPRWDMIDALFNEQEDKLVIEVLEKFSEEMQPHVVGPYYPPPTYPWVINPPVVPDNPWTWPCSPTVCHGHQQ